MRINVEISDETLTAIRELATAEDVTLDQMVERAVKEAVQLWIGQPAYLARVFGEPGAGLTDASVLQMLADEDRQRLGY